MYVCYLDYDGVLHQESMLLRQARVFVAMPGHRLFEWEAILLVSSAPAPSLIFLVLSDIRAYADFWAR